VPVALSETSLGAEREEETYLFLTITPSITPYRLEDADFDRATTTSAFPVRYLPGDGY